MMRVMTRVMTRLMLTVMAMVSHSRAHLAPTLLLFLRGYKGMRVMLIVFMARMLAGIVRAMVRARIAKERSHSLCACAPPLPAKANGSKGESRRQ